jgi:hypothetical protein
MGGIVQTTRGVTRLIDEHPDVSPGTSIAITGLWLKALRYRFNANPREPLPWVWEPSLRPEDGENEEPLPEGEPRKLMIEAALNVEKSQRNYRPAIYVGTGDITAGKAAVDNFVGEHLPSNYRGFHSMATLPMFFECRGENGGESALIGDTAWMFVLATRDIFREAFALNEITNPSLSRTQQDTSTDKEVWTTSVSFSIQFDVRWTTKPIAPLLREMAIELSNTANAVTYFHNLVFRDGSE